MPDHSNTKPSGRGPTNINSQSNTSELARAGFPPVDALVTCDETTITGAGTTDNPLRVIGGGLTEVSHDDSLGGDGTPGNPLGVVIPFLDQKVEVATDGSTITGDGTAGNPLVANSGGGGVRYPYSFDGAIQNANCNATAGEILLVDVSATFDVQLPAISAANDGKPVIIKAANTNFDNSGNVQILPDGTDTIDGFGSAVNENSLFGCVVLIADLTNTAWRVEQNYFGLSGPTINTIPMGDPDGSGRLTDTTIEFFPSGDSGRGEFLTPTKLRIQNNTAGQPVIGFSLGGWSAGQVNAFKIGQRWQNSQNGGIIDNVTPRIIDVNTDSMLYFTVDHLATPGIINGLEIGDSIPLLLGTGVIMTIMCAGGDDGSNTDLRLMLDDPSVLDTQKIIGPAGPSYIQLNQFEFATLIWLDIGFGQRWYVMNTTGTFS